ncbi:MAG: DUF1800 domain-containing protein [Planctomycetota bacterium]
MAQQASMAQQKTLAQQGASPTPPRPGSGTGGGSIQMDPNTDLAPWKASTGDPWDRKKAAHLLRRAGFGGSLAEVDAVVTLGMDRMVDILLSPAMQGLREYGTIVLPNGEILNLTYNLNARRAHWLWESANGFYPLREKLAYFWHDHFSVGFENAQSAATLTKHINIFRRFGLGNFREILVEVTRDPAMLYWLDNYLNGNRGQINENYGRELLELYSLGVTGGYTQQDVVEASRCLTGWTLSGLEQFVFNPATHMAGAKTVLGRTISNPNTGTLGMKDVFDLIEVILGYQNGGRHVAAEFVVKKIWEYFVAPAPYPALLTELANRWHALDYDVRSLMSLILRSNYFHGVTAYRRLVKSPVDFAVGAVRNLRAPLGRYAVLAARVQAMGLPLLAYSNPAGLEEGVAWIDSSTMIARGNLANEITRVNSSGGSLIWSTFDHWREINEYGLTSATAVVDHYLALLVDGDVPAAVRTALIDFMNRTDAGVVPFTFTEAKVREKVRGLAHLILSLPEYQMA